MLGKVPASHQDTGLRPIAPAVDGFGADPATARSGLERTADDPDDCPDHRQSEGKEPEAATGYAPRVISIDNHSPTATPRSLSLCQSWQNELILIRPGFGD